MKNKAKAKMIGTSCTKSLLVAFGLALAIVSMARGAGTNTLTPQFPTYSNTVSYAGIVFPGNPDVWRIVLAGFTNSVSLSITVSDWYPGYPDDYDISLNGLFMGNTLAPAGKTFQATVLSGTTNLLSIAYVNAHTGIAPSAGGSGYNLIIIASAASAANSSTQIGTYAGITITGTVGVTNRIEYTYNLSSGTWIKLADFVLPSSPYTYFDNVPIGVSAQKYYRVTAIP